MPGPTTEVLNEDIKELKEDVKSLKDDVHRLDVGLAEVRTELRVLVGLAKLAIGLMAGTFVTGLVAGIWWASSITSDVRHLEVRVSEVRKAVDELRKGATVPLSVTPAVPVPRASPTPSEPPPPK